MFKGETDTEITGVLQQTTSDTTPPLRDGGTAGPQSQENPEFSARLAAIFLKGIFPTPIDPGWVFLAPILR